MNKITESAIEKFTIELLEKQGYQYIYASDIADTGEIQLIMKNKKIENG